MSCKLNAVLYFSFILSLPFWMSCKRVIQYNDVVPAHDSFELFSTHVKETRVINVWLPKEYHTTSDSLPVMYMADGGVVDEDFPHIANTFDKLIHDGKIKPMILVGITNTQRRRDLTGPTEVDTDKTIASVVGGSAAFRAFIADELIPEIDKRYRTNTKRGILGESLSGLFVMESFFLQPDLFDYYIAFDPSLWWNNHKMVDQAAQYLSNFPAHSKTLWFAGSDAKTIYPYTRQLSETLKKHALPQLRWKYVDLPNEQHITIFRAAKEQALIWALNNH